MARSAIVMKTKQPRPAPVVRNGLDFNLASGVANSDIRIVFDGSNLLPRVGHTAIWRYYPRAQSGYCGVTAHSPHTYAWDSGNYSWNTTRYPASDGVVDSNGQAQHGDGGTSGNQYWEEAGLNVAGDYLCSAGGAGGLQVVPNQWYVQVRKCRVVPSGPDAGLIEHIYIPDLIGNPSFVIRQLLSSLNDPTGGSTPAFTIGCSDYAWVSSQGSGITNESPYGILRGFQLYNAFLSDTDHAIEAANDTLNAAQTSAGQSSLWHINQNPTPSDISDKKSGGTAHNPYWDTANRPVLYTA